MTRIDIAVKIAEIPPHWEPPRYTVYVEEGQWVKVSFKKSGILAFTND